ncbi:MAG: hypothetical protein ACR2KB_04110 [Chitinophagaceae bacterium]
MKIFIAILITMCFNFQSKAQNEKVDYDKALADSLGADDYGMKSYILIILKTGSNIIEDKAVTDSFQGTYGNHK